MSTLGSDPVQQPLTLIVGGTLYCPENEGLQDVLVGGTKVLAIVEHGSVSPSSLPLPRVSVLDVAGCVVVPGLIDLHMHVTGGGGEMGPESRCPEAKLSQIINAGITTAVGILGTDGTSRSLPNLLAKVRALDREGLTALMYCGAYQYPPPTLTGSVRGDIMHVEQCVGLGELAVSDMRASAPTRDELARVASDVRVAGMLSGKAGLVHVHMGKESQGLQPLLDVVDNCNIPIATFHPTHVASRGPKLLEEAEHWIQRGGTCDFTADDATSTECVEALVEFADKGVDMSKITISTDAFGSFPVLDDAGKVVSYGVGQPDSLLHTLRTLVRDRGWPLEKALPLATSNPASVLKLQHKGKVAVGTDADLLVLDSETLDLRYVISRGAILKTPDWVKKGMFE